LNTTPVRAPVGRAVHDASVRRSSSFVVASLVVASRRAYRLVVAPVLRAVVFIAAAPATKLEVFADVANIVVVVVISSAGV